MRFMITIYSCDGRADRHCVQSALQSARNSTAQNREMPSKNATGGRADGCTDDGTHQARIVAVTPVALNRGAEGSTGEEPGGGSDRSPEDLSPDASFRPGTLRILHPRDSVAAGGE